MNWVNKQISKQNIFKEYLYSKRLWKKFRKYCFDRYKMDTVVNHYNWEIYKKNYHFLMKGIKYE